MYISHEDYKKIMSRFQANSPKRILKEAVEEGNAFTAALAKTIKGGKAKVDGQEITDTSGYDDSSVKENKFDFVRSTIESAAGDKISHTEYDDFGRKIYWSSTNPHVVYYVGSKNQIIKYDGKTGERYPIGDLKHYDNSPDDDATMEEKKPHRSVTGRGIRERQTEKGAGLGKEGLHMPLLQATGQTIDTVKENSMIDAPFGVANPGMKKQLAGPGLQLSNLTTDERKQLGEFVDAVKTTKKAIEELIKKASGKNVKVKEDMGGDRTGLVMPVSEKDKDNEVEDYDTGGYVEAMHPDLFDHVGEIVRIFQEWKNGPMTEPGMEGYAKDDLVDYITGKIRNA